MRTHTSVDTVYKDPLDRINAFVFDSKVASVFGDMIVRSVPGYSTIVAMTGLIAEKYATENSRLYDMGCSTGASALAMKEQVTAAHCEIIGIDNSEAMLKICAGHCEKSRGTSPIKWLCENIEETDLSNASVVVFNFTLQFISIEKRQALIDKVYQSLRPGGVLVLSEKICFDDPHLQAINETLHHDFKKRQGYSDLEISQKRSALEDVLIPETLKAHKERLSQAGFQSLDVWFQCFNFLSLLAIK